MKKKSFFSRVGDFLLGKGFYMVLLLCIMAIGGSGYYLYHLADMTLSTRRSARLRSRSGGGGDPCQSDP